jgi:hypothetical protein
MDECTVILYLRDNPNIIRIDGCSADAAQDIQENKFGNFGIATIVSPKSTITVKMDDVILIHVIHP